VGDGVAHVGRDHDAHGLGHDDAAHDLPVSHPHRVGGLDLAAVHGLQPGADDLGIVGGGAGGHGDDGGRESVERDAEGWARRSSSGVPRTIHIYAIAGRRSHARGDIRAKTRKNAASVPSAWLTTVSAIVMSEACRRNGRYFQATVKSSCMSGHPVDELLAELVEAEVLLGPAVEQPLLAHRADGLVDLLLELGRGLLHGHADVADHIRVADDPRHAGLVLR
jgi:hypothetical protein